MTLIGEVGVEMGSNEVEVRWQQLTEEVATGMKEWRRQHPKATLVEIEGELDQRLARVRAGMLQDLALDSAAAEVSRAGGDDEPRCPQCGHLLEGRGQDTRSLTTNYDQRITLKRSYGVCPACRAGLFPPG